MATDFVQHSAEIKQAAHLVVGTTKTQVSHTTVHFHEPPRIYCKLLTVLHKPLQDYFSAAIFYTRAGQEADHNWFRRIGRKRNLSFRLKQWMRPHAATKN